MCVAMHSQYLLILIHLRSGVVVPPVPVCRLLLVLDYMLFQFSELDPELVKQVQ